jgi:hypothetical protein
MSRVPPLSKFLTYFGGGKRERGTRFEIRDSRFEIREYGSKYILIIRDGHIFVRAGFRIIRRWSIPDSPVNHRDCSGIPNLFNDCDQASIGICEEVHRLNPVVAVVQRKST